MSRFGAIVVIALATLLSTCVTSAQQAATTSVPNLIRYGGTLKDGQGAALASSTAVGVTFAIYKQQDGGAPVWMETQNVTPDAGGNYSVLLGSTTATGLPGDLFSQEEQRWLGVQVQGQAEQPRVLLVSVPYAFKAHEAETLRGKSISDFVLAKDANAANSTAGAASNSGSGSTQTASGKSNAKSPSNQATAQGPTNFSGTHLRPDRERGAERNGQSHRGFQFDRQRDRCQHLEHNDHDVRGFRHDTRRGRGYSRPCLVGYSAGLWHRGHVR